MSKLKITLSMLIFGTIGIFVEKIILPSSFIAFVRALLGTLFLGGILAFRCHSIQWNEIKNNLIYLIPSGVALGLNWILLFEAYRYTTIATATICYYMAPVFVILLSPILLKERLTKIKTICACIAFAGAVLISGAAKVTGQDMKGILFGLAAAALYCTVILLNKFIKGLKSIETTFFQLLTSTIVLIPYVIIMTSVQSFHVTKKELALLIVIGIVHTGIAYLLYFSAIQKIPAHTAALYSYIDPATAIVLSTLVLHQHITKIQIVGTLLILGGTLLHELIPLKKSKKANE